MEFSIEIEVKRKFVFSYNKSKQVGQGGFLRRSATPAIRSQNLPHRSVYPIYATYMLSCDDLGSNLKPRPTLSIIKSKS